MSAGTLHFLHTDLLAKIVPPFLPAPRLLVQVSGIAEIAGGLGLLLRLVRHWAAWGLVLMLIAVFPANIYMALTRIQVTARPIPDWMFWARLPVQAVLIWWILWAKGSPQESNPPTAPAS